MVTNIKTVFRRHGNAWLGHTMILPLAFLPLVFLPLALLSLSGCGGPKLEIVEGTVSVDGKTPDAGMVRFIPIDNTPGPVNGGNITNGQYRLDARGGVALGKYRVEVEATQKTGRQVMQFNGFEQAMTDEHVPIVPLQYTGSQSPLIAEITADFDGRFDINIE